MKRCLSMFLCLVILSSGISSLAEGFEEVEFAQLPQVENEEHIIGEDPLPTSAPSITPEETCDVTPLPEATVSPAETDEDASADSSESPETEISVPTAEGTPLPTAEIETTPEATFQTAEPTDVPSLGTVLETLTGENDTVEQDVQSDFILDGTTLLSYIGEGGDIVVPEGVTLIGAGAFKDCVSLTGVTLASTVLEIEVDAFSGCTGLIYVRIPASVEQIAELNSLLAAASEVRIEVSVGSYAHQYCLSNNIDCICFDAVEPETIEPESIVLPCESLVIGVKEQISLAGWTLLPEGAADTMQYSSKSTKIATVSANGVVTGKRAGTTQIVLNSGTGLTASVAITVKSSPTSVSITAARKTLGQGESMQLGYTLSKKSAGSVTFESLNPEIASVTSEGLVTGIMPGKATIRVKTYNGKSKTVELQIGAAPTEIQLAQAQVKIGVGDQWTLGYSLNESAFGSVSFASSDETVATVDANGQIHAIAQGQAEIMLTSYNGVSTICSVNVMPEPTTLDLRTERSTLGKNETIQLKTLIAPEDTVGTISYKSSSTKIATVSKDGLVSAKSTGTVTITATSYNGLKATLKLTVVNAPSSVSITAPRKTLGQGESMQLGYTLSKKSAGSVTFESLNPEIASVTSDGLVTGIMTGKATIRVKTYNGKSKTVELQIGAAPTEIQLAQAQVKIGVGDQWTLGYSLNEGAFGSVSLASSDETVATVDANGQIYAIAQGQAEITLTAYNGVSTICSVNVMPEPTALELSAERNTLGKNETIQLKTLITPEDTVGTISYKSSSTKIATVSKDGLVSAKSTGTVTITATSYNGLKATLKLTVLNAPSSVSITAVRKTLGQGESMQLGYTLSKKSAGSVTFESLNPEIASVTSDGFVTALNTGTANIKVRTFNGKTASVSIAVLAAPEAVILPVETVNIGCGNCWKLTYGFNENAAGSVSFASSDESIAAVDASGVITACAEGDAQIIVTAHNGVHAECSVHVVSAPSAIAITSGNAEIGVNESLQLETAISPEGTVGTLTWKSSNTKIASVNQNGVVKGLKTGTATITVSTYNNIKASIKLTVRKAPSSVSIKLARKALGVGESEQLSYQLSKSSSGKVYFESLNPEILEVSAQGKARALSVGTAMVRVTTYNGKKGTAAIEVMEAPSAVLLSEQNHTLGIGDSWKLNYSINSGATGSVHFESASPEIASVDAQGNITAHALGSAEISVAAYNGVGAVCTVDVVPAPTGIDISGLRTTYGLQESVQLTAKLLPEGSAGALKFKSSKTSVATVSSSGVLTPKKKGTTVITISSYNGVSVKINVQVVKAATGIRVSAERTQLGVGEETQLDAQVIGVGEYSFESSDPTVLSVDSVSGRAIAHAPGQVVVTASTYNGKKAKVEIEVCPAPSAVNIAPKNLVIGVGDSYTLHAQIDGAAGTKHSFASSDESVVHIDAETGRLEALSQGIATLTVNTYNNVSDSMQVEVIEAVEQIELLNLEKDETGAYVLEILRGESAQLEVALGKYSSIGYSFSVSNDVVSISDDGYVIALRKGNSTITVSAYNGVYVNVNVHVYTQLDQYSDVHAIMHAMGAIDGYNYSNSRDAFLVNYAKGHRMFEIDLQYTSDGELVLWHNWKTNRINSSVKTGYIPTEKEFASMAIFDRYDSLTYRDLLKLMDEYPDAYFFIDNKKTETTEVRNQFKKMYSVAGEMGLTHVLDRMVIMIYSQAMYDTVSSIYPFSNYVLMGYKYFSGAPSTSTVEKAMQFCVKNGIDTISMWDYWWKAEFMEMANAYGLDVNLHTIDSAAEAEKYVLQGVKLITTNVLPVGII